MLAVTSSCSACFPLIVITNAKTSDWSLARRTSKTVTAALRDYLNVPLQMNNLCKMCNCTLHILHKCSNQAQMWHNHTKSGKTSPDSLSLHGATPAYITSRLLRRLRLNIFPCPSVLQLFTPDKEYDTNICTLVMRSFASISYTLKKKTQLILGL